VKVVLVNPPLSQRYVHSIDEPLGLLYLAAAIRGRHEVYIVDGLSNLLSAAETAAIVSELDPDLVGISLVFTGASQTSLEIAEMLKADKPGLISVLGGNTATFLADTLAAREYVDFVVRGEGELTFPQLLDALVNGKDPAEVRGISYFCGDKVVHTPDRGLIDDLDKLLFPARDLLPLAQKYPHSLLSSRGCAYGCIYCSSAAFWKKSFRMRSVDNIIAEIEALQKTEELKYFSFADDCLTLLPRRAREIARRIGALKLDCTWGCTGRIETLSEELVRELGAAGCRGMFFGVESGSERVLKRLGRRYKPENVYEIYLLCLRYGIRPYFSFMVGLPFETPDDLVLTYRLIERLEGVESGVHILTPLPGTPIFNEAAKYGLKIAGHNTAELDINNYSLADTEHLSREFINEAYRKAVGYSLKALRKTATINRIQGEAQKALAETAAVDTAGAATALAAKALAATAGSGETRSLRLVK